VVRRSDLGVDCGACIGQQVAAEWVVEESLWCMALVSIPHKPLLGAAAVMRGKQHRFAVSLIGHKNPGVLSKHCLYYALRFGESKAAETDATAANCYAQHAHMLWGILTATDIDGHLGTDKESGDIPQGELRSLAEGPSSMLRQLLLIGEMPPKNVMDVVVELVASQKQALG
jgi:hypothetical protein